MRFQVLLATTVAGTLLFGAPPAKADPTDRPARKWSQPSYDDRDDSPPQAAPEMEDFPGITNQDDALFDGEGRLIERRARERATD